MRTKSSGLTLSAVALMVLVFLAACNSGSSRLRSITVSPSTASVAQSQQFTATGLYSDGSTTDVSSQVTWSSSNTAVATISSGGLATAVGPGTTTITATLLGESGTATLTIVAPHAVSLVVTPATTTIAVSNTVAYSVVELWSDNTMHPLSGAVTFASGTPATATINPTTGVAMGVAASATADTITATEGALTGTAALTVSAAQARYAYLSNQGDSSISQYSVNAALGKFTPLIPAVVNAQIPEQVVVSPNGLFAYSISQTSATATSAILYHIDPTTGLLSVSSPIVKTTVGTGGFNHAAIDPAGQFLFVLDAGTLGTVGSYSIDQITGALTLVNSVATGIGPTDVLVDHTGKYLYVTNNIDSTISEYSIATTGTRGTLTAIGIATGVDGPQYGAIDPANKYVYIPNSNPATGTVSIYSIGTDGVLTGVQTTLTVPSAPVITGSSALVNAAVDPTNKYVYFLDSPATTTGRVYGFNVTGTGALGAALPSSPYVLSTSATDGTAPIGIAIDPTGVLVAVDNNGSGDISLLQDAPTTGALTLSPSSPVVTGSGTGVTNPAFVTFYIAP